MNKIAMSEPGITRVLERWSIYLISSIIALAAAALAGWQWDIGWLRRPAEGLGSMNLATALGFLLAAFSFLATGYSASPSVVARLGRISALLVLFLGAYCLLADIMSWRIRIDQLLFPQKLTRDVVVHFTNKMSVNTAFCFILVGPCLLRLEPAAFRGARRRRRMAWFPADGTALLIGSLGLLSLIGYLYQAKELYGLLSYFPMAMYSALCFLLLALSLLFASPDGMVMGVLAGSLTGSLMARRLLPLAFFVPIVLGELRLIGHWRGYFSTELGATLLVISIIFCYVAMIWYNAGLLNRRDVDRQQVAAQLTAVESHWEAVVNRVKGYAIYLLDPEGRVQTWNEGAQRIKGYRPEEIVGQPIEVFYTPEEVKRGEPHCNLEIAAARGTHYCEGWRVRKNGQHFWADVVFTAIYDADHRLTGFAKITRDTTEQKLAQEKIAYFARLIEDTSDAIFSTDSTGAIKTWNKASESLFGYSAAEVIGRQATSLMQPQITEEVRAPIRLQLEQQGYWKGEIAYLDSSGERKTILQSVSDSRDAEGKHNGYVIVGRDVTNWKKVEEQLRQFNSALEEQVKVKTAEIWRSNQGLRALASHLQDIREEERAAMAREVHDELGQQLTGLKMDLNLLVKKLPVESKEELIARTQSIMTLLDETIRTVRKIASELRPSILDDLGLVAALEWQGQEFMKRSGIITGFRSNRPTVELPPGISIGLFRICQEALTNVARHSSARNVGIILVWERSQLSLAIQDDGHGIDPERQAKNKTLGLLGMKERAQMMGGKLTIDSKPGEGVTLSITIPINPPN